MLAIALCFSTANYAHADGQSVPINYDNLSFFEEPLAISLGPATLNTNILLDQEARYDLIEDDNDYNSRAQMHTLLETQLPNDWQAGLQYFARYNRLADNDQNDEYTDDLSFFISDHWGTVALGNVTNAVFAEARRSAGFGNANLTNDNFLGDLDETGAFYRFRINAYQLLATVDQEGRGEAAFIYEQPIRTANYFAALRLRKGNISENADFSSRGDTYGAALVGKFTFASFEANAQLGYENIDDEDQENENHYFGSLGMLYKYGSYRFSASGGLGSYDGDDRRAFSLGSRIDVARGLSLNFGLNYSYVDEAEDFKTSSSVRYEF